MRSEPTFISPKDLDLLRAEATRVVKSAESTKNLDVMIAGMALSKGGVEKLTDVLEDFFSKLQVSCEKLPQQFSFNTPREDLVDAENWALFYIFVDQFRPVPTWTFSAKKRVSMTAFQNEMDNRLKLAVSTYLLMQEVKKMH